MKYLPLALLLAACSHDRHVSNPSELQWTDVTVKTTSAPDIPEEGTVVAGRYGWVVRTPARDIEFTEITSATETSHLWGALEGTALGAGIGIVAGAILGYSDGDDTCEREGDCWFTLDKEGKAILGGLVLGILGGGVGLVIGGFRGSDFVYHF